MNEQKLETINKIAKLPITPEDIISICLAGWDSLLESRIGKEELKIPEDIELAPQIIGTFLEKIISRGMAEKYPETWRPGIGNEKDIYCIKEVSMSIEMKTSTSLNQIYGNRSSAQELTDGVKKERDGYYIGINYDNPKKGNPGKIRRISVGWLSHGDWKGQDTQTGQMASLTPDARTNKMIPIYDTNNRTASLEKQIAGRKEKLKLKKTDRAKLKLENEIEVLEKKIIDENNMPTNNIKAIIAKLK